MRISELADTVGLPVATVKYYLREGLLHPGTATAPNQAQYDDGHVRRLRLVRTLVEVGRLPLQRIHEVLQAIDDETVNLHHALGDAQDAMITVSQADHPGFAAARAEADAVVDELGWRVRPDAAVRDLLADAIVAMQESSLVYDRGSLVGLGQMLREIAELEIATVDDSVRTTALEQSVSGTVAYETAYAALRRMALEHESARRWLPARPSRRSPRRD